MFLFYSVKLELQINKTNQPLATDGLLMIKSLRKFEEWPPCPERKDSSAPILYAHRVIRHFSSRKGRKTGIVGVSYLVPYIFVMSPPLISRNAFLTTTIRSNFICKSSEEWNLEKHRRVRKVGQLAVLYLSCLRMWRKLWKLINTLRRNIQFSNSLL